MKTILALSFVLISTFSGMAQTADEIITSSIKATGGNAWDQVNGIKMSSVIDQGGMKMPLEIVILRDGRTYTKINVQGMDIYQNVYDGTNLWSTNFLTMEPEKSDAEAVENFKQSMLDFPSPFFTYKKHGYAVERLADETIDGVNCYKIKMTMKPERINGVEVPNVEFHFIDKDSHALIMTESEITEGEMAGKISQVKFSDYQEIQGVFMAYSMDQGVKDLGSQIIAFSSIEVNPTVDTSVFTYAGK
ncbi:MAG: outer membrane lipoprotein-sorting protein [Flavobacteriales bacterium]|jgi:outer membrane lipoprotein-sorting protein